jgi:hypothetical protein
LVQFVSAFVEFGEPVAEIHREGPQFGSLRLVCCAAADPLYGLQFAVQHGAQEAAERFGILGGAVAGAWTRAAGAAAVDGHVFPSGGLFRHGEETPGRQPAKNSLGETVFF